MATFLILASGIIFFGSDLLKYLGKSKELLPSPWLQILMLFGFLNMHFGLWSTLIATGNRLPQLWPSVTTNLLSLGLSLTLARFSQLGIGALVLGPLFAGLAFNYWFWPPFAARGIGTTLLRFIFSGPDFHTAMEPKSKTDDSEH
jgi:hypothetical protein